MLALFFENIRISLSAILANKARSILTALGIIIGVFSVTLMGTLISGLDKSFESSMSWVPQSKNWTLILDLEYGGRREYIQVGQHQPIEVRFFVFPFMR